MTATAEDLRKSLRRLAEAGDQPIDLAEAALLLAALERPALSPAHYRDRLTDIARDVAKAFGEGGDGAAPRAAALTEALAVRWRFTGDDRDYEDLDNANLMRVIDRRRGLPVTLGILFIHAGRAQGWDMTGLGFPGHFLVRLQTGDGERAILDPFAGGRALDVPTMRGLLKAVAGGEAELEPVHYAPISDREILVRLQNNLKLRHLRAGALEPALAAVERILLFAPEQLALWREAGMMHLRLGDLNAAVAALEQFLARAPNSNARHRVALLVQELRGRT
ncbi:MAG: transglutaminase family protein [Alphaproteobacteria bacterium]|nr:transglutaminase family protein [Alphaproteobacteria bacterium]